MRPSLLPAVAVLTLLVSHAADAAVIHVPADHPTIQAAVDVAADGDSIAVSAGDYPEIVTVDSKHIDVVGVDGSTMTSLLALRWVNSAASTEMGGRFAGFTVHDSVVVENIARDFTLLEVVVEGDAYLEVLPPVVPGDGSALVESCTFRRDFRLEHEDFGSGSTVRDCAFHGVTTRMGSEFALTVEGCRFEGGDVVLGGEIIGIADNTVRHATFNVRCDSQGGSVTNNDIVGGSGLIAEATSLADLDVIGNRITDAATGIDFESENVGAIISDNRVGRCETGIRIREDYALVERNVVWDCGVGIDLATGPPADPTFTRNTIVGCANEGLLWVESGSTATGRLYANLIVANGTGVSIAAGGTSVTLECNDVWDNPTGNWLGVVNPTGSGGNISVDPLFCQTEADNFALQSGSPCLPGNHPDGVDCGVIGADDGACTVVDVQETGGEVEASAPASALRAWPSPARGMVTFHVPALGADSPRTLSIYDVVGRLVAHVGVPGGSEVATWNMIGTDARRVHAGTYFAVVGNGNEAMRARIVVVQ